VSKYLEELVHSRKEEILRLRELILSADDRLTENVKWNAPNFLRDGEDRITMRLQPGDRVELVFHRGSRTRDDSAEFKFDDPTHRLRWAAPDRATLAFSDATDIDEFASELAGLVRLWCDSTLD
jgi:hypothetical protein